MAVPDALSRKPHTEEDISNLLRTTKDDEGEPTLTINVQTRDGKTRKVLFQLQTKTRAANKKITPAITELPEVFDYDQDVDYGQLFKDLSQPPDSTKTIPKPSLQLYSLRAGNIVWVDKHCQPRVCVPAKYRSLLLHEFHDTPLGAHFGQDKTYYNLRQQYIWPSMRHHVEQYVLSCDSCQKNKTWHQKRLGTQQLPGAPSEPWEKASIDYCGPFPKSKNRNDYIVGFICNLVREAIILPCKKSITSEQTAHLFIKHVLPHTGIPRAFTSDRGPQFISHFWEHLWEALQTKVILSSPYHANSNPYIERQNKTFVETLKAFINARQDDWEECISPYEFAYNSSFNVNLGDTPFFLSHGRQPRMPVALLAPTKSPPVNNFVENLHNRIAAARDHLRVSQGRAADKRKDDTTPCTFQVGNQVLLSTEPYNLQLPSLKLSPKWLGPLRILQIRGPNTVLIEVPPRLKRIEPIQNVQHLKPYVTRPTAIGPTQIQLPPDLVEDSMEYEVQDILAHSLVGKKNPRTEYLVRFLSYGPEDDLWLPARNLKNAPEIVQAYHDRQTKPDGPPNPLRQTQRARSHLKRLGHIWTPTLPSPAKVQEGRNESPPGSPRPGPGPGIIQVGALCNQLAIKPP
eukprot:3852153-Rhodomonas_salina.2